MAGYPIIFISPVPLQGVVDTTSNCDEALDWLIARGIAFLMHDCLSNMLIQYEAQEQCLVRRSDIYHRQPP